MTLVVVPEADRQRVLWSDILVASLDEAIHRLAEREGCPVDRIGRWPGWSRKSYEAEGEVAAWAEARGFDGVIWTALRANWDRVDGRVPSLDQVKQHIQGLDKPAQRLAAEYISKAPAQIATAYRGELAELVEAMPVERDLGLGR